MIRVNKPLDVDPKKKKQQLVTMYINGDIVKSKENDAIINELSSNATLG